MADLRKTVMTHAQRRNASRTKLLDAADSLFFQFGYQSTTLDTVAGVAGLHVQTLYRHFPTKEDLTAGLFQRHLDDFKLFFVNRESNALATWREWVEQNARELFTRQAETQSQWEFILGVPPISGKAIEYWEEYEQVLAQGIAEDLDVNPHVDVAPILLACALFGGNYQATNGWLRSGKRDVASLVADLVRMVDAVGEQFPKLQEADGKRHPEKVHRKSVSGRASDKPVARARKRSGLRRTAEK